MLSKNIMIWMWLAAAFAVGARAVTRNESVDRFRPIPERNAFGLKPQEQPLVQPPPPQPLRKLLLTGITTLPAKKRALLKAEPLPGHQGEKEESLILTEGQREGEIEVVQIDEKAGRVTVNNSGTLMTLSFENDAAKIKASASAHSPPGFKTPQTTSSAAGNPNQLVMPQ